MLSAQKFLIVPGRLGEAPLLNRVSYHFIGSIDHIASQVLGVFPRQVARGADAALRWLLLDGYMPGGRFVPIPLSLRAMLTVP